MKTVFLVFFLVCLIQSSQSTTFLPPNQLHLSACYNSTTDGFTRRYVALRPSQSLDNLLSIIEKIENHNSFIGRDPQYIAGYLLSRFRLDGVVYPYEGDGSIHSQAGYENNREIEDQWKQMQRIIFFRRLSIFDRDPVDFYTDDEKCALHWMLSHSVNRTTMSEEIEEFWRPPTPDTRAKRQANLNKQRPTYSRFPRESGVIFTKSGEAVAAGSLLAGIAVMKSDNPIPLPDLINKFESDLTLRNEQIKPLHAATYAINLAVTKEKDLRFGPKGYWNDSICPSEYILYEEQVSATDAVIFGAFDGYFLANFLKDNTQGGMKLSQILRMYYGDGFPRGRGIRSCDRIRQMQNFLSEDATKEVVLNQIANSIIILDSGIKMYEPAKTFAEKIVAAIVANYTESNFGQGCSALDSTTAPKIDPLIDLYVVLDRRFLQSQNLYDEATSLITNIVDKLDISPNTSHVGIYVDDNRLFDSFFPRNDSVSKAEWMCQVKRYHTTFLSGSEDTISTIKKLNEEFWKIKNADRDRRVTSTPGKVLLFVRNAAVINDERVMWEMEYFRKNHPEITVVGVGRSHGDVQSLVPKSEYFLQFSSGFSPRVVAEKVYSQVLLKVGATVYLPFCENKQKQVHDVTGFLAPFTRQYHTIPSQMFNLSTNLKIEVRATGVALEACFSRDENIFKGSKGQSDKCEEIASSGQPMIIAYGDPCSSYAVGYCKPIYVEVKRKDYSDDIFGACLQEKMCRTYEHTKYIIKVEDGFCAACSIQVTFGLLFTCFIISLIRNV